MNIEHLAITLRARSPWEAVDLGFAMARRWRRDVSVAWLLATLPVVALGALGFSDEPLLALVLLWWFKPWYDRALLFVYARAVLGETCSVRALLAALPRLLDLALLTHLSIGRLDTLRSFRLPVMQLEGLRGRQRRQRLAVLARRGGGYAKLLWQTCALLEGLLCLAFWQLPALLLPETVTKDWLFDFIAPSGAPGWQWLQYGLAYAAMSLLEPAYVGAGFALYLNRRVQLEGWDIELAFRRLAARLADSGREANARSPAISAAISARQPGRDGILHAVACRPAESHGHWQRQTSRARAVLPAGARDGACWACIAPSPRTGQASGMALLMAALLCWLLAWMPVAGAQPAAPPDPDTARRLAHQIEQQELGSHREVVRWLPREEHATRHEEKKNPGYKKKNPGYEWLADLSRQLAQVFKWLGWGVGLTLGLYLLYRFLRWREAGAARTAAETWPEQVAGLDIRPQSLPADVPAAVRRLWADGQPRAALSLLYRATLSALVHRHAVRLRAADTEGEVLHAATHLAAEPFALLTTLTRQWQHTAYAHQPPDTPELMAVLHSWPRWFGR